MCTPEDEDFHDLIAERYERTSTVLSNLDFTEWDDAFATNKMLGAATLDRLRNAAYGVRRVRRRELPRSTSDGRTRRLSLAPLRRKHPAPLRRKATLRFPGELPGIVDEPQLYCGPSGREDVHSITPSRGSGFSANQQSTRQRPV